MSIAEKINQDTVAAMKAREAEKLSVLRMVKTAIKNREIEKREPLTDAEVLATLTTLIKQRRESIDQFTKGNRPELAEKEAAEIPIIEAYMPQAASEEELRALVGAAIAEFSVNGGRPGMKEIGTVMKAVQAKLAASGVRAEGRVVSELVKAELGKS